MKPAPPLERAVQLDIKRNLESLGCYVADLSQPRASMLPPGLPDLYWRHAGWRLRGWMEVKRPGVGRATAHQLAWHDGERSSGGNIAIVSSWADAARALLDAGAPGWIAGVEL